MNTPYCCNNHAKFRLFYLFTHIIIQRHCQLCLLFNHKEAALHICSLNRADLVIHQFFVSIVKSTNKNNIYYAVWHLGYIHLLELWYIRSCSNAIELLHESNLHAECTIFPALHGDLLVDSKKWCQISGN